jgi:hypothetical protein
MLDPATSTPPFLTDSFTENAASLLRLDVLKRGDRRAHDRATRAKYFPIDKRELACPVLLIFSIFLSAITGRVTPQCRAKDWTVRSYPEASVLVPSWIACRQGYTADRSPKKGSHSQCNH